MPRWHQSPKLTPRYFLETPRLFGYPCRKYILDSTKERIVRLNYSFFLTVRLLKKLNIIFI